MEDEHRLVPPCAPKEAQYGRIISTRRIGGPSRSWLRGVLAASALVAWVPVAQALSLFPGDILVTDSGLDAVLRVNPVSGDRTVVSGCVDAACTEPVGEGAEFVSPLGITIGPGGDLFVVDTNLDAVIGIDPNTGERRIVSSSTVGSGTPSFQSPVGITYDESTGMLLVVDQTMDEVFRVNPANGNRTFLPKPDGVPAFTTPWDLILEDSGHLLVSDLGLGAIFRVSVMDGMREIISGCTDTACVSPVGGEPFGMLRSLALEGNGQIVVTDSGLDSVFRVDPESGSREVISSSTVGDGRDLEFPLGLAVEFDGDLLVADFQLNAILRINISDMGQRELLSFSQRGEGPRFDSPRRLAIVPIPEPGTLLLLGLGVVTLSCVSAGRPWRSDSDVDRD